MTTPAVRCPCGLVQFLRSHCRRCGFPLMQPKAKQLFPDSLPKMREMQRALIAEAILRCGNTKIAAKIFGIDRTTIYRRMERGRR